MHCREVRHRSDARNFGVLGNSIASPGRDPSLPYEREASYRPENFENPPDMAPQARKFWALTALPASFVVQMDAKGRKLDTTAPTTAASIMWVGLDQISRAGTTKTVLCSVLGI